MNGSQVGNRVDRLNFRKSRMILPLLHGVYGGFVIPASGVYGKTSIRALLTARRHHTDRLCTLVRQKCRPASPVSTRGILRSSISA